MSTAKPKRKTKSKRTRASTTTSKTRTKTKTRTKSKLAAQKIVPHLWYVREAEEAARFYTSVFPDSRVDRVTTLPAESPSGPAGSVAIVEFTLCGQAFVAFSAGPHDSFNDAVSFMVR